MKKKLERKLQGCWNQKQKSEKKKLYGRQLRFKKKKWIKQKTSEQADRKATIQASKQASKPTHTHTRTDYHTNIRINKHTPQKYTYIYTHLSGAGRALWTHFGFTGTFPPRSGSGNAGHFYPGYICICTRNPNRQGNTSFTRRAGENGGGSAITPTRAKTRGLKICNRTAITQQSRELDESDA